MTSSGQTQQMTTDEVRRVSVDMTALLDDGEILSGTPVIECSDALTISGITKNAGAVTINGATVAANKAIQFTVTPSLTGWFMIDAKCSTDAGQTLEAELALLVKETQV